MNLHKGLHPWPRSAAEARVIQARLPQPDLSPPDAPAGLRFFLGLDCAFPRSTAPLAVAAAALWDADNGRAVRTWRYRAVPPIPYVPGLLGFREVPLMLAVLARVDHRVDAILVDGQGIAHPKRLGSAVHLALWLAEKLPVVGVGKTRLVGEHPPLDAAAGAAVPLSDRGETVGMVLRSRKSCRPLFVSPAGHADISTALAIVKASLRGYRLPEPIRFADQAAGLD